MNFVIDRHNYIFYSLHEIQCSICVYHATAIIIIVLALASCTLVTPMLLLHAPSDDRMFTILRGSGLSLSYLLLTTHGCSGIGKGVDQLSHSCAIDNRLETPVSKSIIGFLGLNYHVAESAELSCDLEV